MKIPFSAFLCLMLISVPSLGSPGYGECQYKNHKLRKNLSRGYIKELLYGNDGDSCLWASSTLKPEGRAPAIDKDDIAHYEFLSKYSPSKTHDRKKNTAWAEGVAKDGIGEVILVPVDLSKPVKVLNGLGKSKTLYLKNNRLKKIRVYYLVPENIVTESVGVYFFQNLKVVEKHEVEIKDQFGFQQINIPTLSNTKMPGKFRYYNGHLPRTVIGIEILSVYRGTKYRDTVISEISN